MSDLSITYESNLYKVSVTLENNSFNKELLKRVFHVTVTLKNRVSACSNFKNIADVSKLIENWF